MERCMPLVRDDEWLLIVIAGMRPKDRRLDARTLVQAMSMNAAEVSKTCE
ncbi:hypothetical protein SAMN05216251_103444 [Actinacidiphila alni]|uniref:Uncharacterized protein n=1 Tax=Actinacidiphila alni TaxID=380248 RepID=A0A1I2BCC4_9ACTN|nr:hypothetical protein SAMN05216251_103444 [Actinacidiphila alni]